MRRVILLGLGLALALAACGTPPDGDRVASLTGGRATTTTTAGANATDKDPQQQAIEFARCMRQHGVDMPDPEVDDQGRVKVRIGPAGGNGRRPDPSKLDEAQKACGSLLGGGDGPGQIDPAARDAMVSFARCMREHGIDMPDPTGDGLVMRKDTGGGGPDPESEAFQRAERACEHHLAGLGRPARQSGGRP